MSESTWAQRMLLVWFIVVEVANAIKECKAHYLDTYINVPTAPLPDISKVLTTSATLLQNAKKMREASAEQKLDRVCLICLMNTTYPFKADRQAPSPCNKNYTESIEQGLIGLSIHFD